MKRILFLLVISFTLYCQNQQYHYYYYQGSNATAYTPVVNIVVTARDNNTVIPYPYTSGYRRFTTTKFDKMPHQDKLLTTMDTVDFRIVMRYYSGNNICGMQEIFAPAFTATIDGNKIFNVNFGNTIFLKGDTTLHTDWVVRRMLKIDDSVWFYRGDWNGDFIADTLIAKYGGIDIRNDTLTSSSRAFVVGSLYQLWANGVNNIIGNGGTLNADLKYFYLQVDSDTIQDERYLNGVIPENPNQFYEWGNFNTHDYDVENFAGGENGYTLNYWRPTTIIDGNRKDTMKFRPVPITDTLGGGIRNHNGTEYFRATVNTVKSAGNYFYAVGGMTHERDSTHTISRNIIKGNLDEILSVGDTGTAPSSNPYTMDIINDTAIALTILQTVVPTRAVLIWNTETGNNWYVPMDTTCVGIRVKDDKFYTIDYHRLIETNIYTREKSVLKVFDENLTVAPTPSVGRIGDTLVFCVGVNIYWMVEDSIFVRHELTPFPGGYTVGGLWYNGGVMKASNGDIFYFGEFKGIGGVEAIIAGGVARERDGEIVEVWELGGISGNCDRYGPSCLQGAFSKTVTNMLEWYPGEYVIAGTFRTLGGVDIGSNLCIYQEDIGVGALGEKPPSWSIFGLDTLRVGSSKVLIGGGDFIECNGLMTNHLFMRMDENYYHSINPVIKLDDVDTTIDINSYPLTVTGMIYSPAMRSITNTLHYYKNYDGDTVAASFTETDSLLTNGYGYKRYLWSKTFSGSVTVNDTVFWWVSSVDNLGNDTVTSLNKITFTTLDSEVDYWVARSDSVSPGCIADSVKQFVNIMMEGIKSNGLRGKIIRWGEYIGCNLSVTAVPILFNNDSTGIAVGYRLDSLINWSAGDYRQDSGLGTVVNTTKYVATGVIPSTSSELEQNNAGMHIYLGTVVTGGNITMMGSQDGTANILFSNFGNTGEYIYLNTGTFNKTADHALQTGLYSLFRVNGTQQSLLRNETVTIDNASSNSTAEVTRPIYVFASNNNWTPSQHFKGKVLGYMITLGMTQEEAAILQGLWNDFETSMERNNY